MGSILFNKIWTINDLYNGAKIVIYLLWMIFLILNFDFRFGEEVKVKLGSPFGKCFDDNINDLYNGSKIVKLPFVVDEI